MSKVNILPQEVTLTPYNALCTLVSLACMLLWGAQRVFRAIPPK